MSNPVKECPVCNEVVDLFGHDQAECGKDMRRQRDALAEAIEPLIQYAQDVDDSGLTKPFRKEVRGWVKAGEAALQHTRKGTKL